MNCNTYYTQIIRLIMFGNKNDLSNKIKKYHPESFLYQQGKLKQNVIHYLAITNNHYFIAELFNCYPNYIKQYLTTRDKYNRTPLHLAVHNLAFETIELILPYIDNCKELIDYTGKSPIDFAIHKNNKYLLQLLHVSDKDLIHNNIS